MVNSSKAPLSQTTPEAQAITNVLAAIKRDKPDSKIGRALSKIPSDNRESGSIKFQNGAYDSIKRAMKAMLPRTESDDVDFLRKTIDFAADLTFLKQHKNKTIFRHIRYQNDVHGAHIVMPKDNYPSASNFLITVMDKIHAHAENVRERDQKAAALAAHIPADTVEGVTTLDFASVLSTQD